MMPSFPHAVAAPPLAVLEDWRNAMAKGQKRSTREPKKPKTSTKKKGAARSATAAPKK